MRKNFTESVDWGYFDKFEPILDKYMPARGEGETMASQAVTAVNKLVYKWYNDGDVFDNTFYLDGWCNDLSDYANWLDKYIEESWGPLDAITEVSSESDYEDLLKDLADEVLTEKVLANYNEKAKVGSIYNCKGCYKFSDSLEDKEDEEDW